MTEKSLWNIEKNAWEPVTDEFLYITRKALIFDHITRIKRILGDECFKESEFARSAFEVLDKLEVLFEQDGAVEDEK